MPFFRRRENRDIAPVSAEDFGARVFGSPGSKLNINAENACASVAVLSCLRVRAETLASMPSHVYQRDGDSRTEANNNPLETILQDGPNDYMTSFDLWAWKQLSEDLWGNACFNKERDARGNVIALWPMKWSGMTIEHESRKLLYRYSGDKDTPAGDYHPHDIVHFKGPILKTPWEGKSLVEVTKETIGLGIEAEAFFEKLMTNGNHFPVYFETDKDTNMKAVSDLQEKLKGYSGVMQAGVTRVFGPGLHLKQNEMTLKDMDFSPQLRWNLEQISRIWRVPLPIINDLTHGTYTNSEQAALWLENYTMSPIVSSTERVLKKSLLVGDLYVKFNMDALRRGDYATRTQGYTNMIQNGSMTRNEVRAKEDLNPLPGLDEPIVALSNGTVNQAGTIVNPNIVEPVVDNARSQIRARFDRDGDTERTRKYARMVAYPVVETMRRCGIDMTVDDFISQELKEEQ
jgi:HK97 family phage portal protein